MADLPPAAAILYVLLQLGVELALFDFKNRVASSSSGSITRLTG
jgi:hypothetical protein